MADTDPFPNNYDSATISVDVGELAYCAQAINTAITDIADALTDINKQLNGMTLSWLGDASSQAQSYTDTWNQTMQMLFGVTDANGNVTVDDGALSVLAGGLNQAIANYSQNEAAITNLFQGFINGSGSSGSPVDSPSDPMSTASGIQEYLYHTTAVNETF
jgi:uncharacterized protein YukE